MPKIEPPNPTAAALVDIVQQSELPREARIPLPPEAAEQLPPPLPYAKANGGQVEKPEDPRKAFGRGLLQFDILQAERDALDKSLTAAREKIHLLEIHINELEGTRGTIESRINTCVLERDQAVREAGELRGALNSVAAICAKYHPAEQD